MSGKVQLGVVDTARWALGARLVSPHPLEDDMLRPIFNGAMEEITQITQVNFEPAMVERVWTSVSRDMISELNDIFLVEFCQRILGVFSKDEISDMLWDLIIVGSIQNEAYSALLNETISSEKNLINNAVIQKSYSVLADWIPVIVKAVEQEGVSVLNPK